MHKNIKIQHVDIYFIYAFFILAVELLVRRFCGEDGTGTLLEFLRRRVMQNVDPRRSLA